MEICGSRGGIRRFQPTFTGTSKCISPGRWKEWFITKSWPGAESLFGNGYLKSSRGNNYTVPSVTH